MAAAAAMEDKPPLFARELASLKVLEVLRSIEVLVETRSTVYFRMASM